MSFTDSGYFQKQSGNNQNCSYYNQNRFINESSSNNNPNYYPQIQKNIQKEKHRITNYYDSQSRRYQHHKIHEKLTKSVQEQNKPSNIKMNNYQDQFKHEQNNIQDNNKQIIAFQNLNSQKQLPSDQKYSYIEDQDRQQQYNFNNEKEHQYQQDLNNIKVNISRLSNSNYSSNQNQLAKLWQRQQNDQSSREENNYQSKFRGVEESKFKTRTGKFMNKIFFKNNHKSSNDVHILEQYDPNQNNNTKSIFDDILSKIQQEDPQLYEQYQHTTDVQVEDQKNFNEQNSFNSKTVFDEQSAKNQNNQIKTNKYNKKEENQKYHNQRREQKLDQQHSNVSNEIIFMEDHEQHSILPQGKRVECNNQINQNKITDQLNSLNYQFGLNQNCLEKIEGEQQKQNQIHSPLIQNQIKFIQNNVFTPEKDNMIKDEFDEIKQCNIIQIDDNSDQNQVLSFIPLPTLKERIDIVIVDDGNEDLDENLNSTNIKVQNAINLQQNITNNQQNQINQNIIKTNQNIIQNIKSKNQAVNKNVIQVEQDNNLQQINNQKQNIQYQVKINQNMQEYSVYPQNQINFIQSNNTNTMLKNLNNVDDYINTSKDNQQNIIYQQIKQKELLLQHQMNQLQLQQKLLEQQQQLILQSQIQLQQQQQLPQKQQQQQLQMQQQQPSVQQQQQIQQKPTKKSTELKKVNTFFRQKQQILKNLDSLTEEELIKEYEVIYNF
ncbi:hypothetical protein TTHERM_00933130 (macronuclear) [Tetrahymena thermophila SB210]|uniref:Uncharacterized protein n=1 Tax=Tetrahymena thermophila (strain SB210) TaxID=312017 RepID=I7MGL1_TETTS|nr:hypothetical protein TTHERM_00933130 [Tetrahymena thermophila SB210]EAS01624.1 hypothetical protein TTHERM_00933130 [Tetrahymena thermophila SB210]|eukprot:XP_001021869.1 hypothetical protein TTHERM_00933130 [Tetrahymena thermophila SB210]